MKVDSVNPVFDAPTVVRREADPAAHRDLIQAIAAISRSGLFGDAHELTFALDRETKRPVMKIVDRATNEVISQIPNEQALRIADHLTLLAQSTGE